MPSEPTGQEHLNCEITRAIDNSGCSYEQVINVLVKQLAWMYKARHDEHGTRKITRKQILEGLKKLSDEGRL